MIRSFLVLSVSAMSLTTFAREHQQQSSDYVPSTESQHVSGYTRTDGTYVQPYERTRANDTTLDNYSTKGNVNPYTGAHGTKNP